MNAGKMRKAGAICCRICVRGVRARAWVQTAPWHGECLLVVQQS